MPTAVPVRCADPLESPLLSPHLLWPLGQLSLGRALAVAPLPLFVPHCNQPFLCFLEVSQNPWAVDAPPPPAILFSALLWVYFLFLSVLLVAFEGLGVVETCSQPTM